MQNFTRLKIAIEAKGYEELTIVQNLVLEQPNEGKDLLVSSQTGSGKTLAYGLSISSDTLQNFVKSNKALNDKVFNITQNYIYNLFLYFL